ncbi:MAG: FtsW/RodA/SpoVE family cell cycle protein [bacterium]
MSRPQPQNWILLGLAVALSLLGVISIWSAQVGLPGGMGFVQKQLISLALGLVSYIVFGFIPLRTWMRLAPVVWIISAVALVLVLTIGKTVFGGTRWIDLGPLHWQPSEFAKLALILCGAAWLPALTRMFDDRVTALVFALAMLPLLVLVLVEPDLGTTITMAAIIGVQLVAGPLAIRKVGPMLLAVVLIVPLVGYPLMQDYQRERVLGFLNQEADAQGRGYQVTQSKIAIGSGGMFGKGLAKGTQNRLNFIPGQHTDFIFTVIGEEGGFVGSIALLVLYLLLFGYLIFLSTTVGNVEGSLVILGVVTLLATHTLINLAMTMGAAPVTGIPLPFMSAGGSALLHAFMALGLANSAVRFSHQSADFAPGM